MMMIHGDDDDDDSCFMIHDDDDDDDDAQEPLRSLLRQARRQQAGPVRHRQPEKERSAEDLEIDRVYDGSSGCGGVASQVPSLLARSCRHPQGIQLNLFLF